MRFLIFTILIFILNASCQKEFGNGSLAPGSLATFTLNNPSGNCTNTVVNGTYIVGISLTAAHTISIKVFVTSIGSYSLSTNTVNGISFSTSGAFTSAGEQTIHLLGTGTPVTHGIFNFSIGSGNCSFSITAEPSSKGNAVFTYHGAPNSCTNVSRSGIYNAGIPLTSLNRIKIDVNVIATGSYTITTPIINGFSFFGTGIFETMGFGTVILQGTGTPVTSGGFFFTPSNNGCRFPIFVNP